MLAIIMYSKQMKVKAFLLDAETGMFMKSDRDGTQKDFLYLLFSCVSIVLCIYKIAVKKEFYRKIIMICD